MNRIWKAWGLVCLCAILSACASVDEPKKNFGLANKTPDEANATLKEEWAVRNGKKPTLGLALSGGGTKAGVFAHGVLQGLHDTKVLEQVDVISSASGGGYAAYWYFSKLKQARELGFDPDLIFQDCYPGWWDNPKETPDMKKSDGSELNPQEKMDIIALKAAFAAGRSSAKAHKQPVCEDSSGTLQELPQDPFRWQAHLLRWPDMMGTKITKVTGDPQGYATKDMLSQLGSVVFELTFGWLGGESKIPLSYQEGIERTWGLNPAPRDIALAQSKEPESRKWTYTNAEESIQNIGAIHVDPKTDEWLDLQKIYQSATPPPLWVLNTTQGNKDARPNLMNLYELTPFSHGSLRWGFRTETPPVETIATGVRAAAAFADSQGIAPGFFHNFVTGLARFVPAAKWGVKIDVKDKDGKTQKVRLSDGGGADDLGLVSLVRRGLTDIIVADSAQDDHGIMDDLCWSKIALRGEGLFMTFPQLEKFDEVCEEQYPTWDVRKKKVTSPRFNVSNWMNPVLKGTVKWGTTGQVTSIWLIKAAWDQEAIRKAYGGTPQPDGTKPVRCGPGPEEINCILLAFYGHNTMAGVTNLDGDFMKFPQHGTVTSTANGNSSYQTLAYRELGRMLASRIQSEQASDGTRKLSIIEDRHCMQHGYVENTKGRPGPSLEEMHKNPAQCDKAP